MNKIITGHEAEIESIEYDTKVWESNIKNQLEHIIATAQSELDDLALTHDVFGNQFEPGSNKVNHYALDAIVACVERIKKLQS